MKLKELMTEKFSLIEESSSVDEARSRLSSDDFLVVTSDEGLPLSVITESDLTGSGEDELRQCVPRLPPTILVGCDLDVSSIQGTPAEYLLNNIIRGAALLGEQGVVGVVPAMLIRSYLEKSVLRGKITSLERELRRITGRKERTIPFTFGEGITRSLVVAWAGTLGGNRVLANVPRRCNASGCGWLDCYRYILPTTKCKNPNQNVGPQPWPHTLV